MDADAEESVLVDKGPCDECGSSDANCEYTDGHRYCFSCGHYTHPDGETRDVPARAQASTDFLAGVYRSLPKRGITEETCRRYSYTVAAFKGEAVHVAQYFEDGVVVAQKLRFAEKDEGMPILGRSKKLPLFGQWINTRGAKMVVITEGEIDALTVSQVQGNKWPVVSIPLGCDDAAKALARSAEWLNQFDKIVLMFDMDKQGRAATDEAARVLPPGKAFVATLPLKDPNEMLLASRSAEIIDAVWNAKPYRPSGVVDFSDLSKEIKKPVEWGLPWFSDTLTRLTYGRRYGEIYCLGAGTGIGKTDFFTQQIIYDATQLKAKIGLFFLEQQPQETGKRLAGKLKGRRFHIPRLKDHPEFTADKYPGYTEEWTDDELDTAVAEIAATGSVQMFDSFGATSWELIRDTIRFMAHSDGVRIFYLDHLTALAAAEDDERKALERITAEMGSLVKELDIMLIMVSHLATPEGKPHEEGGRVMIRHFKGSRAIGFWCHYMFGLERDQQAEDPEWRKTTTFRVLKDRYTGNATGEVFYFGYDINTGQLYEREAPVSPDENGFSPVDQPTPF